jgi:hypothetical protein
MLLSLMSSIMSRGACSSSSGISSVKLQLFSRRTCRDCQLLELGMAPTNELSWGDWGGGGSSRALRPQLAAGAALIDGPEPRAG